MKPAELRRAILEFLADTPVHRHIVNTLGRPGRPGDLELHVKVRFDDEERNAARMEWEHLKSEGKIAPSMTDLIEPMNWYVIRDSGKRELAGVAGWVAEDGVVAADEADDLTRLYRRGPFDRDVEVAVASARHDAPVSCLMIDLDDFKAINDKHGHAAGDDTLRRVAICISSAVRGHGRAYRYGGDEFAALLVACDGLGAERVAEEIQAAVGGLASLSGQPVSVTVGVATSTTPTSGGGGDLVARADAELLEKKQRRKGSPPKGQVALPSPKVVEILKSKGRLVTLSQMNTGKAAQILGSVRGYAEVTLVDCNEFYATISSGGSSRSIPLSRLDVSRDDARQRLELQERPA